MLSIGYEDEHEKDRPNDRFGLKKKKARRGINSQKAEKYIKMASAVLMPLSKRDAFVLYNIYNVYIKGRLSEAPTEALAEVPPAPEALAEEGEVDAAVAAVLHEAGMLGDVV